jgi:hypothetical protein
VAAPVTFAILSAALIPAGRRAFTARAASLRRPLVGSQNLIELGDRTRYPFDAGGGRINPSRASILADTKLAGLQGAKLFLEI